MRFLILASLVCLVGASPANAQSRSPAADSSPPPVPIEEWSLEKISRTGVEIYEHDTAAWVATDALRAAITEDELKTVRGWLIERRSDGSLSVHFYRQGDPDLRPGWDILVTGGKAGDVAPASAEALTADQLAQARALATARANIGRLRCSPSLNSVIIDDPDSDGWLVWLLTPMPDGGQIPMGGHYRFRISADGGTVLRRDQLSNSCLFLDRPAGNRGEAMLFTTQIVSKGPVETQVFLSIQNQVTIAVGAGDRFYAISGAGIRDITDRVNKR